MKNSSKSPPVMESFLNKWLAIHSDSSMVNAIFDRISRNVHTI
jgi:hypothetical protein